MKTRLQTHSREQGTALLVALFLTTILAVTIAGYLKHGQQQNLLSVRSQTWNNSIAVSEAGVEEALQHLNSNLTNLTKDGWWLSGNAYTVDRTLNSAMRYQARIYMTNSTRPVITAQAFVSPTAYAAGPLDTVLAAVGVTSPNTTTTLQPVSRAVRIQLGRTARFQAAMVAKYQIDMNGNNVTTDSFDSTDANYSTGGMYDATKAKDNGDVASNASLLNAVSAGNANIYGKVRVGPGGTLALGPNGGVGTRAWQAWNDGVQPGYFADDMNFTFPSESLPYTSALTPSSGTLYTTNYQTSSGTTTTATFPSPMPASGVKTNASYKTVSSLPSPTPAGTVTNYITSQVTTSGYPAPGTYLGAVTVVGNKYRYQKITGYTYTYPTYTYTYTASFTNTIVTSASYDYILTGTAMEQAPTKYYLSSMSGSMLIRGNCQLVVGGNISLTGNSAVTVDSNGKLEMWVNGSDVKFAGNGVVNQTGFARNFIVWCTDNVTSFSLSGNGQFTGVLWAPNADLTLNGGGNSNEDFVGALVSKTVRMNGHFKFHYDEALESLRNNGRFTLTQWDEIPITQLGN